MSGERSAKASWPVEVVDFGALLGRKRSPGEATQATLLRKDGQPSGYMLCCPKCGELGHGELGEDEWTFALEEGHLSLNPSVQCRCGGHFWLTDGVLKEV